MMETSGTVEFLTELMRLKALPRTGWLLRGVREVESIADHLFGVAWIAMLLADRARSRGQEVSVEKVLRMALLHDLSEARTGDLPSTIKPYFPGDALKQADEKVVCDILQPLGEAGAGYLALWHEYEQRTSLESRIVKAADKLDLLLQAREYEKGGAKNLGEFWDQADEDFARLGIDELIADILVALKG
jgi:putative hydrolases of HD superfamily